MTGSSRVYLDTNVFIALREHEGPETEQLVALAQVSSAAPKPGLVTSELTLAELLVKPLAQNEIGLTQEYEQMIGNADWLMVLPVGRDVLRQAAQLRSRNGRLKLPDAIHIGSALVGACSHFLTADLGIKSSYFSEPRGEGLAPLVLVRPDVSGLLALAHGLSRP